VGSSPTAVRDRAYAAIGPGSGPTTQRLIADEFFRSKGARWIARSRALSRAAFAHVRRRVRGGLRYGVAVRIEDDRRRTLLVRMNPTTGWTPNWTTPGGGDEPGETPRRTVVREIAEETGVRVRGLRLWRVYHETLRSPDGDDLTWEFLQYTARWSSGRPRSRVPEEIAEVRWFSRLPPNLEFRDDWLYRLPSAARRAGRPNGRRSRTR